MCYSYNPVDCHKIKSHFSYLLLTAFCFCHTKRRIEIVVSHLNPFFEVTKRSRQRDENHLSAKLLRHKIITLNSRHLFRGILSILFVISIHCCLLFVFMLRRYEDTSRTKLFFPSFVSKLAPYNIPF